MYKINGTGKKLTIPGYKGTWYVIDTWHDRGRFLYMLESEQHGEDIPWLCVDVDRNVILDNIHNGVEDVINHLIATEL